MISLNIDNAKQQRTNNKERRTEENLRIANLKPQTSTFGLSAKSNKKQKTKNTKHKNTKTQKHKTQNTKQMNNDNRQTNAYFLLLNVCTTVH